MKKDCFSDDSDLVEGCVDRDLAAWDKLVDKYLGLISISIRNLFKKYGFSLQPEDLKDIRQDVLASIWEKRKLEEVRNRRDISYWLSIVAANTAIEYLRARRRLEPQKTISLSEKIGDSELSELTPSSGPDPLRDTDKDELSARIDTFIKTLPEKERLIIKLNFFHDKKYCEIAKLLGLPAGTVSNYLKRAKERLKDKLKDLK